MSYFILTTFVTVYLLYMCSLCRDGAFHAENLLLVLPNVRKHASL